MKNRGNKTRQQKRREGTLTLGGRVLDIERDLGAMNETLGKLFQRYHDELKLAGMLIELLTRKALGKELTEGELGSLQEFAELREEETDGERTNEVQPGGAEPGHSTGGEGLNQ